jgi:hypothetical protein
LSKNKDDEMIVDVTEYIAKRRKGYKMNLIIGIILFWFIPIGPMAIIASSIWLKKSDEEMIVITKKVHDKIAAKKNKTVKYINEPS